MDDVRARYLRDRVLTASPAQRVVMLYDRLTVDVRQARASSDAAAISTHVGHAVKIVAELYGSLDVTAGGPAENLAGIYSFLLGELLSARSTGTTERLEAAESIIMRLRDAWAGAAEQIAAHPAAAGLAAVGPRTRTG